MGGTTCGDCAGSGEVSKGMRVHCIFSVVIPVYVGLNCADMLVSIRTCIDPLGPIVACEDSACILKSDAKSIDIVGVCKRDGFVSPRLVEYLL